VNYRHGYHAGNFADVVKHLALTAILLHLRKKETAFSVVDSHAGRGSYDLAGAEAGKTGEAQSGIARLAQVPGDMPEALSAYLSLVKESGAYPGSPLLAAKLLRPQDRLTAIEKNPAEFAVLENILVPYRNCTAECADGYTRTLKLLPPPSRRGLVLMDPPFEAPDEFSVLAQTLRDAVGKFATGIFLIWYPIKSQADADAFAGEVLAAGVVKAMTIEAKVGAAEGKLARAGLLVINPPYGMEAVMREASAIVGPRLDAVISTSWLAGGE